ncbi:hypothetical protein DL240_03130 [Lujinxingia litoralis]|uniref:Uncharacterized protein n=1 Tax=Lujinxingia litoralis TaxID=2211119 RepID=A0A328CB18_9DELT|nr:hypothetical protein [Lujinxingia litoralis]RAL25218.1 hypothetical protein DL240_03130 [Lujinxingia litoralis]
MQSSKLIVLALGLIILGGVIAWSYVNFFETPPYDPKVAHEFAHYFERRCVGQHDETICADAIGTSHRGCFEQAMVMNDAGDFALDHDRDVYMNCMRQGIAQRSTAP